MWNLHYLADLFRTWVEVDGVVIPLGDKVPSGHYLDLHYLADLFGNWVEVDGVVIPSLVRNPYLVSLCGISITLLICL